MELTLTDEQLVEALEEAGHEDIAEALAEKLEGKDPEPSPPADMNRLIRDRRASR